jgi:DNA-binding transcriptional ArsR family regulator
MSAARGGAAAGAPDESDLAGAVLRALADPHRRQILRLVRGGELAAGEIASHFDATQQAVSHHLQVLAKDRRA